MWLVSAALLLASGAEAQQSQTPGNRAILAGVVVDSIRGGYLRGASVFVSGTALSATTDSAGRFRIDGIPAGNRVMEVQHPLLDSLGIALATAPRAFADGDSSFVLLSVPSLLTYAGETCPADELAKGPGLIVGTVTDAESEKASAGSSVSIEWTDYEVAKKTIRAVPQKRSTSVSADGTFRLCGLPDDLIAGVVATRGGERTAPVEVNLASLLQILSLRMPPPRRVVASGAAVDTMVPAPPHGTAFVSGRVFGSDGKPVSGARVAIDDDDAVTQTDANGGFSLGGLRPGTRRLEVRKIGFEPAAEAVDVRVDGTTDLRLTLGKSVAVLKSIVVSARRDANLQRIGFTQRQHRYPGAFLTPEDVAIRNGPRLSVLLETVHILKRSCVRYFIDGFLQATGDLDEYLSGAEIGAVEVYSSSFVPAEFTSFGCGAVLVWTKAKLNR